MRNSLRAMIPVAAASLAVAATPVAAHADTNYQATLNEINGSGGSGNATISVDGDTATVDLSWSGLAQTFNGNPYPHVQHIHIGAAGECPDESFDDNGDGIVDTVEGQPAYGSIGTTLSVTGPTGPGAGTNLEIAPTGSQTDYHRTFELNAETMEALESGTGVIVVHGLNPADLSDEAANASSNLVPELPLAATSPALCGALNTMPTGGADTGNGSTAGVENAGLLGLGGGLLAAAAAFFGLRRRAENESV